MEQRLNIMLANGSLFGGGAEHVIVTLARQLRASGHQVTIAVMTNGGDPLQALVADGFEVLSGIGNERRGLWATSTRLRRVIAERLIDVVHSHDLRSLATVGVCRLQTRAFRHLHTFHFGNYPHVPAKRLWLERVFARTPDQLVAVGNVQRQTLMAALKLPSSRITTIWNGVDGVNQAGEGVLAHQSEKTVLIGSVSAFTLQKGLSTLLQAAAILRGRGLRFRILLVGDGPLRHELQSDVTRLGLDDVVEFTGWLPHASRSVLPRLDVFVQSSHWEAMSVVVLEAMAAGCAIIATSVGENPSVLTQDETAIVVSPRDAESLASGLGRLIVDHALRSRLGRAARDAYKNKFTAKAMAEHYITAYDRLLRT